jgi:hypothetical protein
MDAPTVALITGLVSAAVTSLGWIVLHFLTRKREIESRTFLAENELKARMDARAQSDRTRRLEVRLNYYERQIHEFYAPLYSCIQLIWNVWEISEKIDKNLKRTDNEIPREEVMTKIGHMFGRKYYAPLHDEIREILKTKLFLMEGVEMPESFTKYLMHSVMENIQSRLAEEEKINTSSVEGVPWPYQFPIDVKAGLDQAMRHYDEAVQELSGNRDANSNSRTA